MNSLQDGLRLLVRANAIRENRIATGVWLRMPRFDIRLRLEELSFDHRGLDKTQILSLATGSYIRNAESVLITVPRAAGKLHRLGIRT